MHDATFSPPLPFYYTMPMVCPYLPGQVERRLVADLSSRRGRHCHDRLALAGFRRSQTLAYRPACPRCQACLPIRARVADFDWRRGFRRIMAANRDLRGVWRPAEATREQFTLFSRYQTGRHDGGEMATMDYADYADMVERSPIESAVIEYRRPGDALIAAILTDVQADGLSAVYSFFRPEAARRGLGSFMILDLIRRASVMGLSHVYLGYWIRESPKMAYKARFRPCEVLWNGAWVAPDGAGKKTEGGPLALA